MPAIPSPAALLATVAALLVTYAPPPRAQAQGAEFRINTTVADSQNTIRAGLRARAVARNGTGSFVVVWQSFLQDGDGFGIFGQRYGPTGIPQGTEFAINTSTAGAQVLPAVSIDNNGNFVVVWSGEGTGDTDGVFARLYDSAGSPRGNEFRVNQTVAGVQEDPDVAMDNGGDFAVVWHGNGPGDTDGIFRRLYSSSGTPRTGEARVNSDTTGAQARPAAGTDSNGDFVVVWDSQNPAGDLDVWFQRYSRSGSEQGSATLVNSTTAGNQMDPAVARDSNGDFVVAWESAADVPGPDDPDLFYRRFSSSGTANGPEAPVTTATAGAQRDPAVDLDGGGRFLIAWANDDDPTSAVDWNIRVQQFAKNGAQIGSVIVVNETQAGDQVGPALALNDIDDYTVVWSGNGIGDADGVFGRLLRQQAVADLALDQVADDTSPLPGQSISCTISVTNNGPNNATGIRVTDLLPPGLTYVSDIASQGTYTSGTGIWDVGSIGVAATAALRITAQVDASAAGATLVNTASVSTLVETDPAAGNDVASVTLIVEGAVRCTAEPQLSRRLVPGSAAENVFRLRLVNESASAETLQALTFTNAASGPGTPAQLDADWAGLELALASGAAPVATGAFAGGRLAFVNLAVVVAGNDSLTLVVRGGASVQARDSDILDLRIAVPADVAFYGSPLVRGGWPLDPAGSFAVDGMSAAQIVVRDVAGNLYAGSPPSLALDLTVPPNGYQPDQLQKLNIVNFGTALDSLDIDKLEAWVDDGDAQFAAASDRLLGPLAFTGNRWEITGLAEPVGLAGLRVYVSVATSPLAQVGRTVRLGLDSDNDVAIGMQSANDGPVDQPVANRIEQTISAQDQVTLNAATLPTASVHPGARGVPLLDLVATNSYPVQKQLTNLALANVTTSPNGGTRAQLDGEIERLTLQVDGDGDGVLDAPGVDPILGTSFFASGRARFENFAWDLPSGVTRHLFVTADASLGAADGDRFGVRVDGVLELGFADPTSVIASWPLDSGSRVTVDGMVAAQSTNFGAPGATLGPGEGPALALDVQLPANGYASDVLEGLTLENLGSATGADLADLRLWRDGGDGRFTPGGGDDREIGAFVQVGNTWKSTVLGEPLAGAGARLFVGVTSSNAPADSSSLRLVIPMGGIQTESGNDGPLDFAIANPEPLLFSTAPLLATLSTPIAQSTVGQDFAVQMQVRNVSLETITAIAPSLLAAAGDAGFALASGPVPASIDLMPGSGAAFDWVYRGTTAGTLQLAGGADGIGTGGIVRRSLRAQTQVHTILLAADSLVVQPVGAVPFSINRGETDVVPMSLTLTNPGGATSASVRLRALRIRVEDEQGGGIVPAEILSRLALSEGATTYAATTALPASGAEVALALSSSLSITPSEPATISIRCDILPGTVVPAFRVAILQADWFTAVDATGGSTVGVHLQQGSFPIRSGTGHVHAAPTELDVQALPGTSDRAGRGQRDVALLRLQLLNPGVTDLTSNVRVGQFAFALTDTTGTPLGDPSRFLRAVRLKSGPLTLDDRSITASPDTTVHLALALPAVVPVNVSTDLVVLGDVAADAPLGPIRLRLDDPARFDARDESTNAPVPAIYATTPLQGTAVVIEAQAESLRVRGTPAFPPSFSVGETGRTALVATLRHPGTPGVGRIRIAALTVSCRDETRRALAPDRYIDALRVLRAGLEIGNASLIPTAGGVDVPIPDLRLDPGESVALDLVVDIEAAAPATYFELLVQNITATDANVRVPVQVVPEATAEMPLTSGLTKLASPATELVVGLTSRIPPTLVGDGAQVPLGQLSLRNSASAGGGDIQVDHLVLRAMDEKERPLAIGRAVLRVIARRDGQVWAVSDTLTPDSVTVTLRPAQPLFVQPQRPVLLDVLAVFRADPGLEGLRAGVDAVDVGVVQPASAVLGIRVAAELGQDFPLWTQLGSFSVATLRESFANFPNPFAAGRENTTFVYYLPAPGRVSLRILTPRGETVAWLLHDANRAAGLQQVDLWPGKNGRGLVVTNGVYIAELAVDLADGTRDRLLRKVAVVR